MLTLPTASHPTRAHPDRLATGLALLFRTATWLFWRRTLGQPCPTQDQALAWLAAHRGRIISPAFLASALGVSRSTVTRIVAGLVNRRLVEKHVYVADHRRRALVLTHAGQREAERLAREGPCLDVLRALSSSHRHALAYGLAGFLRAVSARRELPRAWPAAVWPPPADPASCRRRIAPGRARAPAG